MKLVNSIILTTGLLSAGISHADNVVQDVGSGVTTGVGTVVQGVGEGVSAVAEPVGDVISDSAITSQIKSQLAIASNMPSFDISVTTVDGIVTLSGSVQTQDQMDRAVKIATDVNGVKGVKNELAVVKN